MTTRRAGQVPMSADGRGVAHDGRVTNPSPQAASRKRMTGKERREQLLDIGRRLFAERGFEGTSIEEIAAQAGVSKPVVYEHFGGKEGLYAVVVDREVERLLTMATDAPGRRPHPGEVRGGRGGPAALHRGQRRRLPHPGPRLPPGVGRGHLRQPAQRHRRARSSTSWPTSSRARGYDPKLAPDVRADAGRHGRVHRAVVARRPQAQDGRGGRPPGQPGLERPVPAGQDAEHLREAKQPPGPATA